MMKTSVILATYNGEEFLEEQLESIVQQTMLPSEIVISDDGSTDQTLEIIHSFFNRYSFLPIRFILVRNDTNAHGVTRNFENALRHASGDYVFFCDQDDIWHKNKVERMVEFFETAGADANVAFHNARVIKKNEKGEFTPIDRVLMEQYPFDASGVYKLSGERRIWSLKNRFYIFGMCLCARRSYLLSILPFSKGKKHDDWVLFCSIMDDTLYAVADELAYYRIHDQNTCGITEYRKTRSFFKKIQDFTQKSKKRIYPLYIWYKDTEAYYNSRVIKPFALDKTLSNNIQFYTKSLIDAVRQRKIIAIYRLCCFYKKGTYQNPLALFHDIYYVLTVSQKKRIKKMESMDSGLRSQIEK